MSQTKINGMCAAHMIITPACRENRTPCAAFEEAVSRVFDEYMAIFNSTGNEKVKYHLVLTVERPLSVDGYKTRKVHSK